MRVPVAELTAGPAELGEQASHYVLRVHRLAVGDGLTLFDPVAGVEAEAELVGIATAGRRGQGARRVQVRIGALRPPTVRAERPVTLVQGMAKGDKLDAIVRDATELGATEIVVAACERSVRRSGRSDPTRRWRRIAVEAARQCGRGELPAIAGPEPLPQALRGRPCSVTGALGLCLHPAGDEPLGPALRTADPLRPLVVLVGPEGGFTAQELALAGDEGYRIVRLGPFVLRTETVCAAVLGAVAACSVGP